MYIYIILNKHNFIYIFYKCKRLWVIINLILKFYLEIWTHSKEYLKGKRKCGLENRFYGHFKNIF